MMYCVFFKVVENQCLFVLEFYLKLKKDYFIHRIVYNLDCFIVNIET